MMKKMNVDNLFGEVCFRDENTKTFFASFVQFIKTSDPTCYVAWIQHHFETHDTYRGFERNEIMKILNNDMALFEDIKKNGIKKPLTLGCDTKGFTLDGCHRLAIAYVLGIKEIKVNDTTKTTKA